jgi:Uma2 family endonuclease
MNLTFNEQQAPFRIRFAQPISSDELERFCVENDPLRIERDSNGELIVMSPTHSEGGGVESEVLLELGNWARKDGRGRFFGSTTGFTLPDSSVRAADAAWVSWRRWDALSPKERKSYAPLCPEFVIEIRSESDRLAELQAKMEMWVANGAEVAWLIDPQRKAVEIYRSGDSPEVLHEPSSVQGTGPVAGFELVMARVWG